MKSRRRSGGDGGGPKKPRVQSRRGFPVIVEGCPGLPVQWQCRLQETGAAVLACLSELVRPSVEFLARSSDRPENAATRSVARPTQLEEGRAM